MILVTGGTGFLGSHLVKKLLAQGEAVRVLARTNSPKANLENLSVEFIEGDLRNAASLFKAVEGVSIVYHVAADYRLIYKNPKELYDTNVQGTINLLTACKKNNISKIVYTSSVATIGIPKDGTPGNENTPATLIDMIGHYKRSKFLAEQEALNFAKEGLPVIIVNPSTPVGSHDRKPTSTGQMILDFLNRRMPAYVETGLNIIDAEDVADGHILAAQKGRIGERYILGNRNMTLLEIFNALSTLTGLSSPKVKIPLWVAYAFGLTDKVVSEWILKREPQIPLEGVKMARKKMFFSAAKAIKELKLPQTPVDIALEKAIRWFQDQGYVKTKFSIQAPTCSSSVK